MGQRLEKDVIPGWVPVAALGLLALLYLWEIALQTGVLVARDVQMFFIPQKHLLWEALQHREVPLWTPYVGAGAPFLANFQSGVFYAPHWLYAVLPFFPAFNLLILLHFAIGGLFSYLLCRRLKLGPVPAFVGAATWMLGGYFASLLNLLNALQGAAWAPALAWASVRYLDSRTHRSLGVVVVVGALALLAGEPQSFLFSGLTTGVVVALAVARDPSRRDRPWRAGLELALAGMLVIGLASIQILPTLELLSVSGRGGGLTFGEAAAYKLHPSRLIYLLVPPDYGDPVYSFGVRSIIGRGDPWLFSVYLGALWPILLYLAWLDPRRRRETWVWTAVAVIGTVVALGPHTPVFGWLYHNVPGVGSFRFPEKYFFLTAFAGALIAALGTEVALDRERARTKRHAVVAATWVGALVIGFVAFRANPDTIRRWAEGFGNARMFEDFGYAYGVWSRNLARLLLLTVLGLGTLWLRRSSHLSRRACGLLLAALVSADLLIAHRNLNPVVEPEFYQGEPAIARHVPLEEVRRDYRYRATRFDSLAATLSIVRGVPVEAQKWLWQQIMAPNIGQYWRVLQQDAWDAIKLRGFVDERDLQRVIPDWGRRWNLLRLHSVRYVHSLFALDTDGQATGMPLDSIPGYLYEVARPLPRAFVAPASIRRTDPVVVINEVLAPDFDPRSTVVLLDDADPTEGADGGASPRDVAAPEEPRRSPAPGGDAFPGAAIAQSARETVRVRLEPDADGHLVLTDSYYPGWRAEVDGVERPIERANFFFRAVRVAPGDREVVFRYESTAFARGRLVSGLTLAIAVVLLVAAEARRSGRREPAS